MKKIMIICSKKFYNMIPKIKEELDSKYEIYLPNCYDKPNTEFEIKELGRDKHVEFKSKMFRQSEEIISNMDAVLVLNMDKEAEDKVYKNYIGGATFLEMYDAFRNGKKIYLYNDIPEGMLYDEIVGFGVEVINGNLERIDLDV